MQTSPTILRRRAARHVRLARLAVLLLGATPLAGGSARAETTVPLELQVELLRKVVRFERGFVTRGGPQVVVLLVTRGTDPTSVRVALQLRKALEDAGQIAGKPVKVLSHPFASAAELKKAVAQEGAQLIYLTPGFEPVIPDIAAVMVGVPSLTVSTDGDQVDRGVVLGFALVSARPKIALNIGQARRQGLDFNSDLFRLARVVQ